MLFVVSMTQRRARRVGAATPQFFAADEYGFTPMKPAYEHDIGVQPCQKRLCGRAAPTHLAFKLQRGES